MTIQYISILKPLLYKSLCSNILILELSDTKRQNLLKSPIPQMAQRIYNISNQIYLYQCIFLERMQKIKIHNCYFMLIRINFEIIIETFDFMFSQWCFIFCKKLINTRIKQLFNLVWREIVFIELLEFVEDESDFSCSFLEAILFLYHLINNNKF